MIKFGEWLPDEPELENPGLTECLNCIPAPGCYKPFPSAEVVGQALDSKIKGVWSGFDDSASVRIYAGTKTKLYDVTVPEPFDLSPVAYNVPDDGGWEFAKFADRLIATNGYDPVQYVQMGGSLMADLSADAPKARHICTAKNFVVLANVYDPLEGNKTQRVHWSAIGESGVWPTPGSVEAAQKQSSYQDLNDNSGGWINAIVGGETMLIFLQQAIYLGQYVGGNIVWQFDPVEGNRGLVADKAIARIGRRVFFLDRDGFFMFMSGAIEPIGHGKVDDFFWQNVNTDHLYETTATTHPNNKLVIFSYVDKNSGSTIPDKALIYNWVIQRWSHAEITDCMPFANLIGGYTLETLDEVSESLDDLPESLDSRNWNANDAVLSGFDADFRLVHYTGTPLNARIESQEIEINPGRRSVITGIRPVVNGSPTVTVKIGSRSLHNQSLFYSSAAAVNPRTGWHDLRIEGRYQRVQINTAGDFTKLVGFDINAAKGGYV